MAKRSKKSRLPVEKRRATGKSFMVIVSRQDVEAANTAGVLELLAQFRSHPAQFRQSVVLMIDGYNDDSRALPDVPEVKAFIRHLHTEFPWWFYYLLPMAEDVLNAPLTTVLICVLADFLRPTQEELVQFVDAGFSAMNEECERVGDSEEVNRQMSAQINAWIESILSKL